MSESSPEDGGGGHHLRLLLVPQDELPGPRVLLVSSASGLHLVTATLHGFMSYSSGSGLDWSSLV